MQIPCVNYLLWRAVSHHPGCHGGLTYLLTSAFLSVISKTPGWEVGSPSPTGRSESTQLFSYYCGHSCSVLSTCWPFPELRGSGMTSPPTANGMCACMVLCCNILSVLMPGAANTDMIQISKSPSINVHFTCPETVHRKCQSTRTAFCTNGCKGALKS